MPVDTVDIAESIGESQMFRFWVADQQIWFMIRPSIEAADQRMAEILGRTRELAAQARDRGVDTDTAKMS